MGHRGDGHTVVQGQRLLDVNVQGPRWGVSLHTWLRRRRPGGEARGDGHLPTTPGPRAGSGGPGGQLRPGANPERGQGTGDAACPPRSPKRSEKPSSVIASDTALEDTDVTRKQDHAADPAPRLASIYCDGDTAMPVFSVNPLRTHVLARYDGICRPRRSRLSLWREPVTHEATRRGFRGDTSKPGLPTT